MIKIVQVESGENLRHIRELFEEYAASLDFGLHFQGFGEELAGLPGEYSPPDGCLLMALWEEGVAGCVALAKINGQTCEMKRMYVRRRFRRKSIGRKLAEAIIDEARRIGYKKMRLDTVPSMKKATALYRSLGFKEIAPYRYNPIPGALFMEMELD